MTTYGEQLCRSEKRVNLIEGSLQIARLLLSNDQTYRSGLTCFLDLVSGVVLLGIFHVFFQIHVNFSLLLIRFRTKSMANPNSDSPSYRDQSGSRNAPPS